MPTVATIRRAVADHRPAGVAKDKEQEPLPVLPMVPPLLSPANTSHPHHCFPMGSFQCCALGGGIARL